MKHSLFINVIFVAASIAIIWWVITLFSSRFTDPEFKIDEFQLNVLFAIIGIFGGIVISIFFHYASKFRDQYFEYQQLVEDWKETKQKILFHIKNYQTFEHSPGLFEETWLENRKVVLKMVYLVMSIFIALLVWFVNTIHYANRFHQLNEFVYALIILAGTFAVFIFGWRGFERALNSSKNRILLIKHYISNQKIYLYKLEHQRPKTD